MHHEAGDGDAGENPMRGLAAMFFLSLSAMSHSQRREVDDHDSKSYTSSNGFYFACRLVPISTHPSWTISFVDSKGIPDNHIFWTILKHAGANLHFYCSCFP